MRNEGENVNGGVRAGGQYNEKPFEKRYRKERRRKNRCKILVRSKSIYQYKNRNFCSFSTKLLFRFEYFIFFRSSVFVPYRVWKMKIRFDASVGWRPDFSFKLSTSKNGTHTHTHEGVSAQQKEKEPAGGCWTEILLLNDWNKCVLFSCIGAIQFHHVVDSTI